MYDIWLEPPRFDAMAQLFLEAVNMSKIRGEI